jgi:hypothetical protein
MTPDPRPCKGDLFQPYGPDWYRFPRLDCRDCALYEIEGDKCAGRRGFEHAAAAGITLKGAK